MEGREERIDLIYHLHHFHDLLLFVPHKLSALVVTFSAAPHDPLFFYFYFLTTESAGKSQVTAH